VLGAGDPQHLPQEHGLARDRVPQGGEEAHVRGQVRAGREQVDHVLPGGVRAGGLGANREARGDLLVDGLLRAQDRDGAPLVGDGEGLQIPDVAVELHEEVGAHVEGPEDHVARQQPREDGAPHGIHEEGVDQGQVVLDHGLHRQQLGELQQADVEHVIEGRASKGHARAFSKLGSETGPLWPRRAPRAPMPAHDLNRPASK
jgi:hypothetical protein